MGPPGSCPTLHDPPQEGLAGIRVYFYGRQGSRDLAEHAVECEGAAGVEEAQMGDVMVR
jgi:hypothetical protein